VPSIELSGVHFAYADSVPLLADASLVLRPGWTGVVGANGAGKTTLLQLIARQLTPDVGEIFCHPASMDVRLCAQRVEHLEPDIVAFGSCDSGSAHRARGWLDLAPETLGRWPSLSPGERKRWQVGAALAAEPGTLLLDEPTNHLDREAREGLLLALDRFRGIGVVVSHDRSVLNRLTSSIARVRAGEVVLYRGNYDTARSTWEAVERQHRDSRDKLRRERSRQQKRLADSRRKRAQAESRMRTSKHMKNHKDSSARLQYKAKRRRSAEVSLGREIGKLRRDVDRIDQKAAAYATPKSLGASIFVDYTPAPMRRLLRLETPYLWPAPGAVDAGKPLARDIDIQVDRDTRVHLAGPNGSGKTTLLARLAGASSIPRERLLWLPQEISEREGRDILAGVRALDASSRGRLLNVVAALGVDPDLLLASELPSPGEARKLALARGLAQQVWALILDEPTNHLDLPSIERLEEALACYPGALVLVSHDERFASQLTKTRWELGDERLHC
jgi:ATPase subunit of ABC transporter with duplicated ATPase domains